MGIFDALFGWAGAAGAQAAAGVTSTQPVTSSGGTYVSSPATTYGSAGFSPSAPTQQSAVTPIYIAPIKQAAGSIIAGTLGITQTVVSGIQGVAAPVFETAKPVMNIITAPATLPAMAVVGGVAAGFGAAQNILFPQPSQQPPPSLGGYKSGGPDYTPVTFTQPVQPTTIFVPGGAGGPGPGQIAIEDAKVVFAPTSGEIGVYQVPRSIYETEGGFKRIYGIQVSGGSAGAAQSGMFSTRPLTPAVYTQESGGTKYSVYADVAAAETMIAHPADYSRIGAERYAGYAVPLIPGEAGKLQPGIAMGRYPAESGNIANLVNPYGVNQPKGTWEHVPWTVPWEGTATIRSVDIAGELAPISFKGMADIGMVPAEVSAPTFVPGGSGGAGAQAYTYRTDPLAVILEGAVYFGDVLTFGLWKPGKELLTKYGQTGSPEVTTFQTQLATVESGASANIALGQSIEKQKSELNTLLTGKISPEGKFIGTETEYATYKERLTKLNTDVAAYNLYGEKVKGVIQEGYSTGAIIPSGEGYIINPEKYREYGAFSDWQAGVGKSIGGLFGAGFTRSQWETYKESPAYKQAHPFLQFGTGIIAETVTNPAGLAGSALQGVEIYAGMGLVSAGFAAMAPAPVVGAAGAITPQAATLTEKIGVTGLRAMQAPLLQYGMGAGFVGAGVWGATGGFTLPEHQQAANIGAMTAHLGAMTVGAMAPEGFVYASKVGGRVYTSVAERMMVIQRGEEITTYTARPDITKVSGVGGDITIARTTQTMAPTTINIFGYDIPIFPRTRTPAPVTTTTQFTDVDVGAMTGARLTGTEMEPVIGKRVAKVELRSSAFSDTLFPSGEKGALYPGQPELAHGTGTLNIAEMRLPQTIREYTAMGVADAKLTKLAPEEVSASLMADAARVTEPTTGYRTLDVYVPKGTDIFEAFEWTSKRLPGTTVELNKMNIEDYVGAMKVTQTGKAAYEINIVRDVTEQGFAKGGSYDVTGSQVPETKIVSQLKEVSKGIQPLQMERGYSFDIKGNLIREIVGEPTSVDYWPIKREVLQSPESGGYFAHQHPITGKAGSPLLEFKLDLLGDKSLGIKPDWTFKSTRQIMFTNKFLAASDAIPSRQDIIAFLANTQRSLTARGMEGTVAGEYIVSGEGVTIFRPDISTGWGSLRLLKKVPSLKGETPGELFNAMRSTGADIQFTGKNEPYQAVGLTRRATDITVEMQTSYPEGFRTQLIDVVDRMVLKNPNLEFIREPGLKREPSLMESGSNLGRGGISGPGYGAPSQMLEQVSQGGQVQAITEPSLVKTAPGRAAQIPVTKTEIVFVSAAGRGAIPETAIIPKTEGASFLLIPSAGAKTETIPELAKTFSPISATGAISRGIDRSIGQTPVTETVKAIAIGSDIININRQDRINELVTGIISISGPLYIQEPSSRQRQASIQTPIQTTTPQIPIPIIQVPPGFIPPPPMPPIFPPWLPGFDWPAGGGYYPLKRPRRRNFLEIFRMGLDIAGPIIKPPPGMRQPKLKRSGIPGGRQKIKLTRWRQ